ncbi:MAG: hypothetical protein ACD_21C00248G0001 [uncultured bacterium]|nr:MAG: hypothetical protein ACD_21C00248G0001 [uncultured bacterium]
MKCFLNKENKEKTDLDGNDFSRWHKEFFVALLIGIFILILIGLIVLGFIPFQEIDDTKLKDAVLIETVMVDKTPVQFSYYLNEVDDEGTQQ